MDLGRTCAVAIMAKAPRPGYVKTRLQGLLRPEEAAALGTAFLCDTLANLHAAAADAPIDPFVAYAPRGEEARFDGLLPPGTSLLLADGTKGDAPDVEAFGRVLLETMRALLERGYGGACVLAADSPTLPTAELARSAHLLLEPDGPDAVLGPSEDGGYWILGLRAPHAAPFARIRWSTEDACADTIAQLAEAGLTTVALRTWFDVDDPAALRRLLDANEGFAAPHTTTLLERFELRERLRSFA